jgi:RNA polymerase sigma-70 factor (ECF subfamily)
MEQEPSGARATDHDVCDGLVSGEAWASDALYERVAVAVEGTLNRLLGACDSDREDLAQQTFERVILTVVDGRFKRNCSLRSWAAVIAQNLAVDEIRARRRARTVFEPPPAEESLDLVGASPRTPEHVVGVGRRFEQLRAALGSVRRLRAEAFVLHDVLGYEIVELARLTGVSPAAAQSRLVRGRRDLLAAIQVLDGQRPQSRRVEVRHEVS